MRSNLFLLSLLVLCCLQQQDVAVHAVIYLAPTENLTVPLGQTTPVVFTCTGQGLSTNWIFNGREILSGDLMAFDQENEDIEIKQNLNNNGSVTQTMKIDVSIQRNETKLSCIVRQMIVNESAPNSTSSTVTLFIAGSPVKPSPIFHVVNSTHIKVEWNKPFAFPEFDVKYYTLAITNTSSDITTQKIYNASAIKNYPVVHYLNNGEVISQDCIYLNFSLTATNDAGTSAVGFTTGGFPIAPSPISMDSLVDWVTFSADGHVPMLHVNFTFPLVCDYHDANYSVTVMDTNKQVVAETGKIPYDQDGPDEVTVVLERGMKKDTQYTAMISVSTAVATEVTQFSFSTKLSLDSPTPAAGAIVTRLVTSPKDNQTVIIASATAFGLLVLILFILITTILVFCCLRSRRIKQSHRAEQREIEADEAVQRAAKAMIPNPIYSGNPIYEEIVDAKLNTLKSLHSEDASEASLSIKKGGITEAPHRDGGYVELSADAAVRMVTAYPIPEESKFVEDKYAVMMQDETYTVMNPVGALTHQTNTPTIIEQPPANAPTMLQLNVGMDGNSLELHPTEVATTTVMRSNGHLCAASHGPQIISGSFSNLDEQRYVMGSYY